DDYLRRFPRYRLELAKRLNGGMDVRLVEAPPEGSLTEPDSGDNEATELLSPAQQPDEIGRLGTYRILKVLGKGGMGLVFHAEDLHLKRRVALKVMRPDVARRKDARERFLREAQAAAAIEHDHIITIHQVGEVNGVPFLAMPLLKGLSLEERLQKVCRLPL